MGTRSFISIKHKDNTYSGVYCHWDGSPNWNGKILVKDYQARSKVVDLIDGGDMSALKTRSTWDSESLYGDDGQIVQDEKGYMMYKNDREPQPLYYHERGETDWDTIYPKHFKTYQQMFKYAKGQCCEYIYTFDDEVGVDQPWWSFCGVD
jgi:hypothetical protein